MYIHVGSKRKRCGSCTGCTTTDCGTCQFCTDKPKFGGPGRKKRCCEKRKCVTLFSKGLYMYNQLLCKVYKYVPQYTATGHQKAPNATTALKGAVFTHVHVYVCYTCTYLKGSP